jgi:hypothetical protein
MGVAFRNGRHKGKGSGLPSVMDVLAPTIVLPANAPIQAELIKDWMTSGFLAAWQDLYDRAVRPSPVFDPDFLIPYLASHRSGPLPSMLAVTRRVDGQLQLLALLLLAPSGRGAFRSLFRTPEITQQDVAGIVFGEPLLTPVADDANAAAQAIYRYLHSRRASHTRFVLKGLRNDGPVANAFQEAAQRSGLSVVAVRERHPTLGLDFEPSARILPVDAVEIFATPEELKLALERLLAIDATSGQLEREPLVRATGMAIFLRALVRSLAPRQRVRIAIIDVPGAQAAAISIETASECFLWRVVGRDRSNPLLEAALSAKLRDHSGKVIHAATDAPISGLGLKPLPLTSLRVEFDAFNGRTHV